jgi:hypothetical protein
LTEQEVFEYDMRIAFGLSEDQGVEFPTWSSSRKVARYESMNSQTSLIIGPITDYTLSGKYYGDNFGIERIAGLRVIVGNAVAYRNKRGEKFVFSNLEEITGYLSCNNDNMSLVGLVLDREMFPKLKRVRGIELTDEDRELIFSGKITYFPQDGDPRLKQVFY